MALVNSLEGLVITRFSIQCFVTASDLGSQTFSRLTGLQSHDISLKPPLWGLLWRPSSIFDHPGNICLETCPAMSRIDAALRKIG